MVRVNQRSEINTTIRGYRAILLGKRLALLCSIPCCALFAGCSQHESQKAAPAPVQLKQQLPPQPEQPSEPPSPPRGYLMQHDLPAPKPRQAAPQQQAGPRYDPRRLKEAAEVKSWSNVNVEGKGVDCWLKTCWKNGQMSLRLAMLGSPEGLHMFVDGAKQFRVRFSDATGAQVNEYTVAAEDMAWAPPTVNGGVPTLQFESSVDCSLEEYEQYRQWQLFWDEP